MTVEKAWRNKHGRVFINGKVDDKFTVVHEFVQPGGKIEFAAIKESVLSSGKNEKRLIISHSGTVIHNSTCKDVTMHSGHDSALWTVHGEGNSEDGFVYYNGELIKMHFNDMHAISTTDFCYRNAKPGYSIELSSNTIINTWGFRLHFPEAFSVLRDDSFGPFEELYLCRKKVLTIRRALIGIASNTFLAIPTGLSSIRVIDEHDVKSSTARFINKFVFSSPEEARSYGYEATDMTKNIWCWRQWDGRIRVVSDGVLLAADYLDIKPDFHPNGGGVYGLIDKKSGWVHI
jgi:hypothetical protein